jgi:ABC-2 type transport system ATP-binding protein
MEEPAVVADGLGVRTNRGWVYRGFDLKAEPGQLIAVAGLGGTGRTSALLTLGGRMRPSAGSLRVCGRALPRGAAKVRGLTAVARIGGAMTFDDELRVADFVRERAVSSGVKASGFGPACQALDLTVPAYALVGSLPAWQVTALGLALALMEKRHLLLLDDLDTGADGEAQAWLWGAARRAASPSACSGSPSAASASGPWPASSPSWSCKRPQSAGRPLRE